MIQRVFNYRLSRTHRIIENVFGICASRFRVLRRPIIASPKKVVLITKAIVALHNFLISITEDNYNYCPTNFVDQDGPNGLVPGEWRRDSDDITGLVNIRRASSNNHSRNTCQIRNKFKEYFCNEGPIDWQWDMVKNTNLL